MGERVIDAEVQGAIDGAVAEIRRQLQDLEPVLHRIKYGRGTPQNRVRASVGSIYLRLDGGAGTSIYVKESGTGEAGWVAK